MNKTLLLFSLLISAEILAQTDPVFERLSALDNNNKIWYNIDGYSITSEVFNYELNEKGLKKLFRKHSLINPETKIKDENIESNNYYITTKEKIIDTLSQTNSYYFVENKDKTTTVVWFIKSGNTDKKLEEKLVNFIIKDEIPKENFVPMVIDSLNFSGREIFLPKGCYWTFLNTVLCPYNGEMNWSVHKTSESAIQYVENQLYITRTRKGGKITSEELINIEFEGIPTQAKKIIYTLTGLNSTLARMSGGRSLTVYYVTEKVRANYLSCVMSHWNNDDINSSGLPLLLEKVMKLK